MTESVLGPKVEGAPRQRALLVSLQGRRWGRASCATAQGPHQFWGPQIGKDTMARGGLPRFWWSKLLRPIRTSFLRSSIQAEQRCGGWFFFREQKRHGWSRKLLCPAFHTVGRRWLKWALGLRIA
jgi:hypothetical protein